MEEKSIYGWMQNVFRRLDIKKCQNNTAHELINTGTLAHKCNASIHHDFSYRTSYQFIENTGELYLVKVTVGYTLLIYYFNTIMIF